MIFMWHFQFWQKSDESEDIFALFTAGFLLLIYKLSLIYAVLNPLLLHTVDSHRLTLSLLQWREDRFRETSESTNQRVLWWAIAQTLLLVTVGFWQMRHLRGFFEAKKLVWDCCVFIVCMWYSCVVFQLYLLKDMPMYTVWSGLSYVKLCMNCSKRLFKAGL